MRRILFGVLIAAVAGPAGAVDLMGVYELASRNDPTLRAAERRLDAAGYGPSISRASLLPTVDASASKTFGQTDPRFGGVTLPITDTDTTNYRIELRQTIYSDANYGQLTRSRAELAQANSEYDTAWQEFLLRVSERYFDVLTAIDGLRFAEAEETALRRQFEQAEQRFEVGLSAVTDLHEARAAFDAASARTITAANVLDDAKEAMREITGTHFDEFSRLVEDIPLERPDPEQPRDWVDMAIESNPEYRTRLEQLDVADADIRIARAGHLPSVDFNAFVNANRNNEFVPRDPSTQDPLATTTFVAEQWQVQFTLNIPLFEGLAVQSRTRQARADRQVADEDLEQSLRQVVRSTENAFRAVEAGIREVEARERALISAESALEATNAGFEVGTRTIVEVLLSEQQFFQAQRDYSQARHEFILNNLRLRRAAGVLEPEDLALANQLLRTSGGR